MMDANKKMLRTCQGCKGYFPNFVVFLYIFSLLVVAPLQMEAADPPAQAWSEEELDLDDEEEERSFNLYTRNFKVRTSVHLHRMLECLWNFFDEIDRHTFWHSHIPWMFCKPEILPTKNVSHSPYEACEFICANRDHKFMARNTLYTTGLIGDVDVTDIFPHISFDDVYLNNNNDKIKYDVVVYDKKKDRKEYKLNIGKNIFQTIKKEEHDSSIVLNNLRTIVQKNPLDNNRCTIDKENLLHTQQAWKYTWITAGLSAAVACFVISKIGNNRFPLKTVSGTLFSSIIGFLFGEYYWKPNKKRRYYHTQPSDKEVDNKVISLLQPKLTCGVLRLEEEARVISEYLTGNANLPTWRERKIDILQQDHNLPAVIAELIVEFTP